ncbi:hypothetical protein L4X63_02735 [Geomonas sp. Red32]|uniref:hypothetical protein n=1 Tax=Geomonas sp. Red32 TaxID=2912856 RepID=UPI00202CCEE7|nr:hypothetical protein [Geomonas sp. Red32]MCM0080497.1 hypothetical protein [Geomonas sp. Red32]
MKRLVIGTLTIALFLFAPLAAFASLDDFLSRVNIEARADMNGFSAKISTQFGVALPQVQAVIRSVSEPADAFMVFQLGQMASRPPERVLAVYKPNKKKGWGAIAKELGIKPGSAEFHALKAGNLSFTGRPGGDDDAGPGRGKGKGKGHGKGHGRGND